MSHRSGWSVFRHGRYCKLTVFSGSSTWSNKGNLAWYLQSSSNCTYSATVTSGCQADYYLLQWTTTEKQVKAYLNKTKDFTGVVYASSLPSDDYFARVTRDSGGTNNGTITFSKN